VCPQQKSVDVVQMKGTFLLRIDVELAWGFLERRKTEKKYIKAIGKVREILDPLLNLIGQYEIPVTWGILGHLFLDHCECADRPHPDMPRPNYSWFEGDWYKYDPCGHITEFPLWYGKDIVDKIVELADRNPTQQEIGCHSFSHPIFGDPGCSEELARAEIDKCLEILEERGLRPRTFVFPMDNAGHINVLREKRFSAFFGGIPQLIESTSLERSAPNLVRKHASLGMEWLGYYALLPPHVGLPRQVLPGLWEIPSSLCFNKKKAIPMSLVVLKAKKGIRRATDQNKCFHMFTHLHNFGLDSPTLLHSFEKILSFADQKRREGNLEITTAEGLVEGFGKQAPCAGIGRHE